MDDERRDLIDNELAEALEEAEKLRHDLNTAVAALRDLADPQTPLSPGLSGNPRAERAQRALRELGVDR